MSRMRENADSELPKFLHIPNSAFRVLEAGELSCGYLLRRRGMIEEVGGAINIGSRR